MIYHRFPCPDKRDLTDEELDAIAAEGKRTWEHEQKNKYKGNSEGDEWKGDGK
jgi:hypothetical protein